jgi:adenosylmethionine-8-amino-7-oxononanoate aminotransferase
VNFPDSLEARDARHLWHPYTQHGLEGSPLAVVGAAGAELELAGGRRLIDAISSWWTCLHGHGEPRLVRALAEQAARLDHVLFAGATHEPAVALAEELLPHLPAGLSRLFFSDNGSTAVEVALKMVLQRHFQAGEPGRQIFVALEGAYHGDTFGAMAVGDPEPFFQSFRPLLFAVERVPPEVAALEQALDRLGERAAGVIVEPLVQGAAGMRMHGAEFLRGLGEACRRRALPWIADEVLTGFGRTGALFACRRAGVAPDLLCLAKGLTGGLLPLAVTVANEVFYQSFLSADRGRAFFHGHSFTAHPIGCAVARASLHLCLERDVPGRLERLGARLETGLRELLPQRGEGLALRRTGGIVALDLPRRAAQRQGYLSDRTLRLRARAIELGVLLRPLGDVVYALPPACTTEDQADRIAETLATLVREESVGRGAAEA